MRLIMVRHGEPDYLRDCLTDTGRVQAAAAARRLRDEGITGIYSSPQGRARETADETALLLGLPVTVLDFMHEISWGGDRHPQNGNPWDAVDGMIARGDCDLTSAAWREHPYFKGNKATACYDLVAEGIDGFLKGKGYRHEGQRFFCSAKEDETIALFSHGGSGSCAIAHMFNLPFPYVTTAIRMDFTSITILDFPFVPGRYTFPRLELLNDAGHIRREREVRVQK